MRSRSNVGYRKRWSERLGFIKALSSKPVIWVHAVSVGEAIAAKPLIEGLLEDYSNTPILITTTTPTGSDRVKAMFADQLQKGNVFHTYFPYDLLGAVSRFIKIFQPKILIVVETEIWPNLYSKCHKNQIPVVMINARLSEASTQSYLKIKGLVAETLSKVNIIAVRSKSDTERFSLLGAKPSQIQEIGNIKYDISIEQDQVIKAEKYLKAIKLSDQEERFVFVAASTHAGEDEKILFIYLSLFKLYPNLLLIIIPRHPERFNEVYDNCLEQLPHQLIVIRHCQIANHEKSEKLNANVILGDSMGEMQMWFAMADAVFIGGSLVKTGGHNPLEATLYGVPVLSGPFMFNFDDIAAELSAAELLFICDDEFEITKKLSQLFKDKIVLEQQNSEVDLYRDKAKAFMQQHQGVTARLRKIIAKELI